MKSISPFKTGIHYHTTGIKIYILHTNNISILCEHTGSLTNNHPFCPWCIISIKGSRW